MIEINLNNYNEMLRYERDMDMLRALVLWNTTHDSDIKLTGIENPHEYIFDIIKYYSREFATEIDSRSGISTDSLSRFHSALFSLNELLGISSRDIALAGEQQRYRNSGFWEMRRVIGQFGDMAEYVERDQVTHIVTAAVSGCIIGEYLGLQIEKKYHHSVPVDHMIFMRDGTEPTDGVLRGRFSIQGNNILIVDDAVMGTVTSRIMINKLKELDPKVNLSLLTVDIDPETKESGYLKLFYKVYLFEE